MAHKKGAGSSDNGRDSNPQYLGVKMYGGQTAIPGNILVRQRGTKFHAGVGVYMGKDHTLHAGIAGIVTYKKGKDDKRIVYIAAPKGEVALSTAAAKVEVAAVAAPVKAKAAKVVVEAVAAVEETPVVVEAVAAVETPVVVEAVAAVETSVEVEAVATVETAVEVAAVETAIEVEAARTVETPVAKADDLKKIEGIGPKIEELFHNAGIMTFAQLSETSVETMEAILTEAGPRFSTHNPGTWAQQAALAAAGKWDELKVWQDEMDGGRA